MPRQKVSTLATRRRADPDPKRSPIYGYVALITISDDVAYEEKKIQGLEGDKGRALSFKFPPNKDKFEKALERAQNNKLEVSVSFKIESGELIITSVSVASNAPKWI
jgi:hypothetical protein